MKFLSEKLCAVLIIFFSGVAAIAEDAKASGGKPTFGAYIDGYYAYDFGSPGTREKRLTLWRQVSACASH
jgi:hypothetical protein